MNNAQLKQWYLDIYGCYFERIDEYGNTKVIDPTKIRIVKVDQPQKYYPLVYQSTPEPEPKK